jgi:DNA-binding NarL/FixJ family response regulator
MDEPKERSVENGPTAPRTSDAPAADLGASPARVLIADDHALVREGLRAVLEGEGGIEVVGEAGDGEEAVASCAELLPDVVLMDVRMPRMDGLEATRRVKARTPGVSVVMVTMHENPDYLLEAVRAGAAGYVLKDASGERIAEAVRRTVAGESPLEQGLAMRLLGQLASREGAGASGSPVEALGVEAAPPRELPEGITPREAEVLGLMARGLTNPQIGSELGISRGTAKVHVQNIIAKLGVSDRTQAAVRAVELGLFEPGG